MADFEDARRIGLTLPETVAEGTHIGVRRGAKVKGMAWLWNERIHPKKPRVPHRLIATRPTRPSCQNPRTVFGAEILTTRL